MALPLTPVERTCTLLLSDLFLDGDPTYHYDHVARQLDELPTLISEIENFLWGEVYPVLIWNLLDTTGQWGMFFEDQVCDPINARRLANPVYRILIYIGDRTLWVLLSFFIRSSWKEVQSRLVERRASPDSHGDVPGPELSIKHD